MEDILTSLFNITMYPFTSGTYFVVIPCAFCYVTACFGIILRFSRMDFNGLYT